MPIKVQTLAENATCFIFFFHRRLICSCSACEKNECKHILVVSAFTARARVQRTKAKCASWFCFDRIVTQVLGFISFSLHVSTDAARTDIHINIYFFPLTHSANGSRMRFVGVFSAHIARTHCTQYAIFKYG